LQFCAFSAVKLFSAALALSTLAGCATATAAVEEPVVAPADTVIATAPLDRGQITARIDSVLAAPEFRNARWGVLVVHPERGDTLYSRDAGRLFLPASNQKLVTGAVALRLLGPGFRFTTSFAASGPVVNGELRGDLVIHGRGDPTFSTRARGDAFAALRDMADSLAARGVRRIAGRVVVGDTVFLWPPLGYGLAWENLRTRFGAPVADLMFDEASSRVTVRAGARAGAPATIAVQPAIGYPRLRVTAVTGSSREAAAGTADTITIHYLPEEVVVGGVIPLGATRAMDLVHQDPRAGFLAALQTALARRGIVVGNATLAAAPARDTLFTYRSAPLREVSALMQKPSQNQIAEVLLRTIGLELTGVGAPDSGRRVMSDDLLALGAEEDGFIIGDASGLSRYSFLTPETIIRLLHEMRTDAAFVASLPLIGVEGTLAGRMRRSAAAGRGRAKTGTISNGVALSGYLETADGEPLLFSILANNWSVPSRDVERTIDAVVDVLASVRYRNLTAPAP
jgi:serine-type D-Ala-D-Ala carboxypeptidase/endopeptidase (penicillin-binding protein 4)